MVIAILLTGCASPAENNRLKADNISIGYGFSSYAMFGADQEIIDDLLDRFSSLSFEKTTDELNLESAFNVSFYYHSKGIRNFWVDKNGVFWLNGETQCYKISAGSFDYDHLKAVYEGSKNTKIEITQPVWKYEIVPYKAKESLQRENYKKEILKMIDEMTQSTTDKPFLSTSSNPYDYIDAHKDTFNSLIGDGQFALDVFTGILRNSTEFGLDKYIMATVCAEISGIGNGRDKTWASAKEWLELYDQMEVDP